MPAGADATSWRIEVLYTLKLPAGQYKLKLQREKEGFVRRPDCTPDLAHAGKRGCRPGESRHASETLSYIENALAYSASAHEHPAQRRHRPGTRNEFGIYPQAIRRELDAVCEVVVDHCEKEDIARRAAELADALPDFGQGPAWSRRRHPVVFPKREAVFYGAGSLNGIGGDDFWAQGQPICSAWGANVVPVAEFTFAQIILAVKQVYRFPNFLRKARSIDRPPQFESSGAFGTTAGLVSFGMIAR